MNCQFGLAQEASLDLLKLVDGLCREHNIRYVMTGNTLIGIIKFGGFLPHLPTIGISMMYPEYIRFLDVFNAVYGCSDTFSVMNSGNCEQFKAMHSRILKRSGVKLPKGRESDERYYAYHIDIYPMFYAGNTAKEQRQVVKTAQFYTNCINVPPKPEDWWLKLSDKRLRNFLRYTRYWKKCSSDDLNKMLNAMPKGSIATKYIFTPWMIDDKIKITEVAMLYETYENTTEYEFGSIKTFVPQDLEKLINGIYGAKRISELAKKAPNAAILAGPELLRRVQLVQLEMLTEVDRICRNHGIPYSLFAGTLLGAVRHKGIVPWDDDIDVLMLYEDYLRFIEIAKVELDSEKYFIRTQETDKDTNLTQVQIKRNGTLFRRQGRNIFDTHNGIFIDILPLYNGSKSKILQEIQMRIARHYRTATWAHMGAVSEAKPVLKKIYTLMAKPGNKANYAKFLKWATIFKKDRGKRVYLSFESYSPFNKSYGLKSALEDLMEIEFEGYNFFVSADYDGLLTYSYGKKYMNFPPLFHRYPQHLPGEIELAGLYKDHIFQGEEDETLQGV